MNLRKTIPYFVIVAICIGAYAFSKYKLHNRLIERAISYESPASEVTMVWLPTNAPLAVVDVWPKNSFEKDGMIYTKLTKVNNKFTTTLKLREGTAVNYWMVYLKEKDGKRAEYWDAGGSDKEAFKLTFNYGGILQPGYFIFLAGFLPLLLLFFNNRNKKFETYNYEKYRIKGYVEQFDVIRAIAVILVIFHHWLPEKSIINSLPNGPLGVNIFFVLSGFLITGILLKAKKQVDSERLIRSQVFKSFYIRRTLRIFPIYYLLLLILLISKDSAVAENGIYYFTYTSNLLFFAQQFFPSHVAHLWSLAVEEQFYLIWPWLIIFINRRCLVYLIGLFFIIGVSSNYMVTSKDWWVQIFTPACFDAFATGAFLSYLIAYRHDLIDKIEPWFKWIAAGSLILFALDSSPYAFLPSRTTHTMVAIVLIYYCLFRNNFKFLNYILNSRLLRSLGKISYGVYLYHLFVPELWRWINQKFYSIGIDPFYNKTVTGSWAQLWLFVQQFSFLLLLCLLSWRLIEKPINNLKKRFEYKELKPSPPFTGERTDIINTDNSTAVCGKQRVVNKSSL